MTALVELEYKCIELPLGVLQVRLRELPACLEIVGLYPVEILLALVREFVLTAREVAVDLTAQQRNLCRTVETLVDAHQMCTALEQGQGFLVAPDDILFVPRSDAAQINDWIRNWVNGPLTAVNTIAAPRSPWAKLIAADPNATKANGTRP